MVTAELAACLPVLMLVLAVALTAVGGLAARVRLQDAAREAARVAARGDPAAALRVAAEVAPGARTTLTNDGSVVVAVVRARVHPLGGWLPSLAITARAVAAIEPRGGAP
jgi:Flp pilus assembly protein TadG